MPYEQSTQVVAPDETETVFEHAQRLNSPQEPDDKRWRGSPVTLVPKGWELKPVPGWEPIHTDRIRASPSFCTINSFAEYIALFKEPRSLIFATVSDTDVIFAAVLDYHERTTPSLCTHFAKFTPKKSVNWTRWLGVNKKAQSQIEFASFLEDNTADVRNPLGADLLEIINAFEVEGEIIFQKVQRLQDGTVKFAFQNTQRAKSGEVALPEEFHLQMPLWYGEPEQGITARLRYRLSQSGELKLWFELIDVPFLIMSGFEQLVNRVATATQIRPLIGSI